MPFHPHSHRSARRFSKLQRVLTMAAATSTLSLGLLVATESVANAASVSNIFGYHSGLNVAVREGSTSPGAQIIIWTYDGGTEQEWTLLPGLYGGYLVKNLNSGLCIDTDGHPGDTLTQEPCASYLYFGESWQITGGHWVGYGGDWSDNYQLYSPAYNLNMDVYGDGTNPGTEVDAWYGNNWTNQDFNSNGSLFAGL